MELTKLIHRRETEASKLARARGSLSWNDVAFPSQEEREIADLIVSYGSTLVYNPEDAGERGPERDTLPVEKLPPVRFVDGVETDDGDDHD